jgi:hypothetical protein
MHKTPPLSPATAFAALATCSSIRRSVLLARSALYSWYIHWPWRFEDARLATLSEDASVGDLLARMLAPPPVHQVGDVGDLHAEDERQANRLDGLLISDQNRFHWDRSQGFQLLRTRRAWSSTPLLLSLNRAMWSLTWYLAAIASALVPVSASRSRRGRGSRRQPASQVASSSCSGLQVMKVRSASWWIALTSWSSRM